MNSIFDQLTEKEYSLIDFYRKEYAVDEDFCNDDFVPARTLLTEWADAKSEYLFPMFGNKLILSKDISLRKSYDDLREDDSTHRYINQLENWCFEFETRVRHLRILPDEQIYAVRALLDMETLLSNEYNGVTVKIGDYRLTHGCKAIKALRQLNSILHFATEEEFETFRVAQSMCTNTSTLNGKLCLSIHPLDYMTMSDNACDWSSCMSWQESGCYRLGTVEMMNSPCVVVAYLESAHPMMLDNTHQWNSKKWRSLYIVTDTMVTNVKSYPYRSMAIDKIVTQWLYELVTAHFTENVYDKPITYRYPDMDGHRLHLNTDWMYNDFACGVQHWGFLRKVPAVDDHYHMVYSGNAQCMVCGRLDNEVEMHEDSLACEECLPREDYYTCEHCGRRIYTDDTYWVNDTCLCESCMNELTLCDAVTGEAQWREEMAPVIYLPEKIALQSEKLAHDYLDAYITEWCINGVQRLYLQTRDSTNWDARNRTAIELRQARYEFLMKHRNKPLGEADWAIAKRWWQENSFDEMDYHMEGFINAWDHTVECYIDEERERKLAQLVTTDEGKSILPVFMYKGFVVINTYAATDEVRRAFRDAWYFNDKYTIEKWRTKSDETWQELYSFIKNCGYLVSGINYQQFDFSTSEYPVPSTNYPQLDF